MKKIKIQHNQQFKTSSDFSDFLYTFGWLVTLIVVLLDVKMIAIAVYITYLILFKKKIIHIIKTFESAR